jgi:putative glycosyltransferase (TIGR04372 family)
MILKKLVNKNYNEIKLGGLKLILRKIITLFKIILLIPLYIISVPILIFFNLISKFYLVRFENIKSNRLAHFALNTEIYCCETESGINKPNQAHIDLFYYGDISNQQLAKMWKRKLNIMPNWLLSPIHNVSKFLINYFPSFKKHIIGNNSSNDRDVHGLLDKTKVHIEFTEKEEKIGKEYLKKIGLTEKDKFVCLIINDSFYLKTYFPNQDWNYHSYRNFNIDNYILAAEELAKRGYFVFRMGKAVSKPLKSNNHKIIDYANSNLRNDFLDIYIGAKCIFCVSASSGFEAVPVIFRKPLVHIVIPLLDAKTWGEKNLILTKHHYSKKRKKELTLSEIAKTDVSGYESNKEFEEGDIELIENSPEEIRDVVIEAVDRLEGKWISREVDQKLQDKFWNIYYSSPHIHSKRFLNGKLKARFGTNFLRENPEWLN